MTELQVWYDDVILNHVTDDWVCDVGNKRCTGAYVFTRVIDCDGFVGGTDYDSVITNPVT